MTRPARPVVTRAWQAPVVMLLAGAAALVVLLTFGDIRPEPTPGLPDPGPVTPYALAVSRVLARLAAVGAVGLLLAAVVLSPRNGRSLSPTGYRWLRLAGWAATVWAVSTVGVVLYTYSDIAGRPVGELSAGAVFHFATQVMLGQSLAVPGLLAAVVAVICRVALRPTGATIALVLALLALVPPVFTGHAAGDGNHQQAVSAMLLHAVPATVWAGGLLALAMAGTSRKELAVAVQRFSPLAAWCLALVTASGLLSAMVRVPDSANLLDTRYGQLVVAKTVLLVLLAVVGWAQRRAALPALRRGDRRRFAVVAGVEVALFAVTFAAAAILARTAPPKTSADGVDLATAMLGYPMPPPLTPENLLRLWLPDPVFITAGLVAAGAYLAAVWRLHRRGDRWPLSRTVPFLAGCAVLLLATTSGLARYGPVLFSVHMVQHLLLTMIVPMLLVLGGPVTLALRALPRAADPRWPGPREWLRATLHARATRVLTHPVFALAFYVISMYMMYLTSLYQTALRSHAAHLLMMGHFLLAGYLFFWVVIGVDPSPRRRPAAPLRMVLMLASMAMHAFLGIVIMQSKELLAHDWFTTLPRSWGPDPLSDQYIAGGIAWSFGELPGLLVVAALVVQWIRSDEREARRLDRAADRAEAEGRESDELAAYNAMLAELARRDRERMGSGDSR